MKKKILIIEDDQNIRDGISALLTEEGYAVLSASTGKQGVIEAINQLPNLIICDILMKGMDGYQVFEELSAIKETRLIPFIYLTAKVEREDIRKGMELGADDYLFKPFKPGELLKAISARLLKQSRLKADLVNGNTLIQINGNCPDKIFLDLGDKSCFVSVSEIVCISAENQYTDVYTVDGKNLLVRKPVVFWEKTLPNTNFVKIHRSTIINLDFIVKMGKSHNSSFVIYLRNIDDPFIISRRYSAELRKRKFNK